MADEPIKAGDVVILEVTVVKVQDGGSLVVKMPNGSHNVYKPEQVTKKP